MSEGERLILRWFEEVWNKNRLAAVDEMLAEGYETRGLKGGVGEEPTSIEAMKQFRSSFAEEFPQLRIDVQDVIVDGHRVAARCSVEVVQAGSGKKANFGGMCFVHLKDGKIVQAWNNFDFASMRQQLA
jgi:ketosteroid isomerase-like protein